MQGKFGKSENWISDGERDNPEGSDCDIYYTSRDPRISVSSFYICPGLSDYSKAHRQPLSDTFLSAFWLLVFFLPPLQTVAETPCHVGLFNCLVGIKKRLGR